MTAASTAASPKPMADRMVRTRSPPLPPNRPMVGPSTTCVDTPDRYSVQQHALAMPRGDHYTIGKASDEVRCWGGKAWLTVLASPWTWPVVAVAAVAVGGQAGPGGALAVTGVLGVVVAALAAGLAIAGRGPHTDEPFKSAAESPRVAPADGACSAEERADLRGDG
jgi:hypothetical protein